MTRNTASVPSKTDLHSAHFVFLCEDQFQRLARANQLDADCYGWGHAGPCYYGGRVVIRESTLGR